MGPWAFLDRFFGDTCAMECRLNSWRSQSLFLSIRRVIQQIVVIIDAYHSNNAMLTVSGILLSVLKLHMYMREKLWGIIYVDFNVVNQIYVLHPSNTWKSRRGGGASAILQVGPKILGVMTVWLGSGPLLRFCSSPRGSWYVMFIFTSR
jgi:hypothetical protein